MKIIRKSCPFLVTLIGILCFQHTAFAIEKVVGFGDSITAGWPDVTTDQEGSSVGGYEPPLEKMLIASGQQAVVLNYGHPGESTSEGDSRIQAVLDKEHPDVVLVMEGTNDLWIVDTATVMTNLASMVDKVIKSGASPILATITPDTRGDKPVPQMNDIIRAWAKNNNVKLADQYTALVDDWDFLPLHSGDQLHPNQAGYDVIAQTWLSAIQSKTVNITPSTTVNIAPIIMLLLKRKN